MQYINFPHLARTVLAAFLGMALGACAVGPDFQPPQSEAPADFAAWHGGASELLGARADPAVAAQAFTGWQVFLRDPVFAQLHARVLQANADLQSAALRFAQSRALRDASAAALAPQVSVSANAARQRLSETGSGTRLIDALVPPSNRAQAIDVLSEPFNLYQAGFDVSWELDLWGRVRRSIEAADADAQAAQALLAQTQLSVQAELARRYVELRAAQRQLRITREDLAAAQAQLELAQARADGGLVTDLDPVRQRALLADLRARWAPLLAQEALAINQITLLAGERPGALQTLLAARAEDAHTPPLPDLADLADLALGLPSELARRRPDIAQAEAALHSATAAIGVAQADFYPRITLGVRLGLESLSASDFGDWGNRQWLVGPGISLPVFDNGRRRATLTVRQLQQQQAAVAYHQTVLRAWHEVDDALNAYTAARQRHAQLQDKARSSQDAWSLARARYEHGLSDELTSLDAQRAWLQAERELADSDSALALGWVAIVKALGAPPP